MEILRCCFAIRVLISKSSCRQVLGAQSVEFPKPFRSVHQFGDGFDKTANGETVPNVQSRCVDANENLVLSGAGFGKVRDFQHVWRTVSRGVDGFHEVL